MACCGQSRQTYYASTPTVRPGGFAGVGGQTTIFEYIGATSLKVVGSVTGREYRFDRNGARVEIDARDQASVAQAPNLRPIMLRG
jgi:hypothetical protein